MLFLNPTYPASFLFAGDNTDQNGGQYPILGVLFGLKPKIRLSYFLESMKYIYIAK